MWSRLWRVHMTTAGDCNRCVPNADRNSYEDCIYPTRNLGDGSRWWLWLVIACDPICSYGDETSTRVEHVTDQDVKIVMNVTNTHRDWEDFWMWLRINRIKLFLWAGECDPKCNYICHGPSTHDCNSCAEHAVVLHRIQLRLRMCLWPMVNRWRLWHLSN